MPEEGVGAVTTRRLRGVGGSGVELGTLAHSFQCRLISTFSNHY
jgi:hypothetical protein